MSAPINQHYLPQFYLKGFTRPEAPGKVQVFKAGHKYWCDKGIEKVASEPFLHSPVNADGSHDYEIEKMLSQLEDFFAPVLNKILKQEMISKAEEDIFACFVLSMWQRVPSEVDHFNAFESEVLRKMLEMSHNQYSKNPEALERWKKEYKVRTGLSNLDNLQPEALNPALTKITANWHNSFLTVLGSVSSHSELLCEMGWIFLVSSGKDYFITSDHPFSLYDPTNTSRFYGTGLCHTNAEITIPLSRNLAFMAGWKTQGRRYQHAPTRFVEHINAMTANQATRELIAPNRIFPGSNKTIARFYQPAK